MVFQFRFFDDAKNDKLKWPKNWVAVAADAFGASNVFIACIVLSVCCCIFVIGVMALVFCGSLNRRLIIAAWLVNIGGECLLVFGTYYFATGLEEFIAQLKTDNFVDPNLQSDLAFGFSLWLILVSIACQIPMIVMAYMTIPELKEDQAAILAGVVHCCCTVS